MTEDRQLDAIRRRHDLFEQGLAYWLFGVWAVDFHSGRITRQHADIDITIRQADLDPVERLLGQEGWRRRPESGGDGYAEFGKDAMHLDLAFLAADENGVVYSPLVDGRGTWHHNSFGEEVETITGVQAPVVGLSSLIADKSEERKDPITRRKDQADVAVLVALSGKDQT